MSTKQAQGRFTENFTENDFKLIVEALKEKAARDEVAAQELLAHLNARGTPQDYDADTASGKALIKEANRLRNIAMCLELAQPSVNDIITAFGRPYPHKDR